MARARNINPGFFRNADLVELPFEARLLFIGLWTIADRLGRMEDRPKQIKMELFPADNMDCDDLLSQLQSIGLVDRYEHGGKRYLQIVKFNKHQNPHKDERESIIPARYESSAETMPEDALNDAGNEGAQDQHHASTMQAPCNHGATSEVVRLIPDPLIPDSLIPDSHTACASVCEPGLKTGDVCKAMKRAGIGDVNPGNQTLKALIDAGASLDEFTGSAAKAAESSKGFAYALGIVKRDREQAATMADKLHRGELPPAETLYQRSMRERMAEAAPMFSRPAPAAVQTPHASQAAEFFLELAARQKPNPTRLEIAQ